MGKYFWIGLTLLLLFAAGCAGGAAPDQPVQETQPAVKVVTTIYPLFDMVRQLGGDKVEVSYLLPAGASPHTYEPTMEQVRQLAQADLFVYIGAGLDDWALQLTEAANRELIMVELAETVTLLETRYYHLEEAADQGGQKEDCPGCPGEAHDHGPGDPHFWLDPLIARDKICPRLSEALSSLLPEHAAYFAERLLEYQQQLTLLHEEFAAAAAGFSRRDFIAFHSAWQYLGQRYGLHEVAVIAEFPGQEPSAGWIAELIRLVKEKQISAILTEPQFSPALAERIAEESGIKVLVIDPYGGETVPGRETYLQLMRFNLGSFKQALE